MGFKRQFKKIRDGYVIRQVRNLSFPAFPDSPARRYRVLFSGRVQKVGFRLEVYELARRLGLTGFCRNLENGDVLAELQGPEAQIQFLLSFLESLKRIQIRRKVVTPLELQPEERNFLRL